MIAKALLKIMLNFKCSNYYSSDMAEQKSAGVNATHTRFQHLFSDLDPFHNLGDAYNNVAHEDTLLLTHDAFKCKLKFNSNNCPQRTSRNGHVTAVLRFPLLVCFDKANSKIHFRYCIDVHDHRDHYIPMRQNNLFGRLAEVERQEAAYITVLAQLSVTQPLIRYNPIFQ